MSDEAEEQRLYNEMVSAYGRYQFNPTKENEEKYKELSRNHEEFMKRISLQNRGHQPT